ncbi:MAG: tRNA (adenosine(37)-N6)-threonylcarbamoyltransferase complex dimerization subunit type 1 TsaB [Bdellovibrionales bacterium]
MNILAISCSSQLGSVCLRKEGKTYFEKSWRRNRSHGEIITLSVKEALLEANITIDDLDLLAVDIGPGSFTGIRVAVNTIKTISYSNKIPIWPVDSLKILAEAAPLSYKNIVCISNAFKNELFYARFEAGKKKWKFKEKPKSIHPDELKEKIAISHLCLGTGYDLYSGTWSKALLKKLKREKRISDEPKSSVLAEIAERDFHKDKTIDWNRLNSLYIKASAAEEKLKSGLLKPIPKLLEEIR